VTSGSNAIDDARAAATAATYDRIAQEYSRRSGDDGSSPEFLAWRAGLLDSEGPLVDLGCGPGRDLAAFAAAGIPCLGVDLSAGMLAVAARRRLPVVRGDLRAPPLRLGSAATLYSCAALLHVPREQVPATLRAWRDLLRPGGQMHLSTSLGEGEGWELVPYAADRGPRSGERLERWFVHHELDALLADITQAGFAIDRADTRASHRSWAMVSARAE
jgi:SAM-dependent methyltransferase